MRRTSVSSHIDFGKRNANGEDQRKSLSLKAAYVFGTSRGLESEVKEIRDMDIEWDLSYTSSLRRGYIVALFEQKGILSTLTLRDGDSRLFNQAT